MKIEGNNTPNIRSSQTENLTPVDKSQVQRAQQQPAEKTTRKDTASVSSKAQLLSKAWAELENTPEVRQEKIDEIKQQIIAGEYQINYAELAKRMMGVLGLQ